MAKGRSGRRRVGGGGGALEVLVCAYGDRARSLKDAILALLPPTRAAVVGCRCGGAGCLGCGGAAHLLRRGDPAAYRALLARAVCAVFPSAPPPPVLFAFSHRKPVTQRMIVKYMTELILDSSLMNSNVPCSNYDKFFSSIPVVSMAVVQLSSTKILVEIIDLVGIELPQCEVATTANGWFLAYIDIPIPHDGAVIDVVRC